MRIRKSLHRMHQVVCFSLICALWMGLLEPGLKAQEKEQPPPGGERKLRILILEGEGAINNIKKRTAREPVVQIVDENDRPVAGAMVMFTLPDSGASGVFANGSKSLLTYTNASGKAAASGLKANNVAGQFQISVNATHQGMAASAVVSQTNALAVAAAGTAGAAAGISKTLIAIIAIAGGAAAAGAVAASSGGGNGGSPPPPPPPSATINPPGAPTFGPPN